MERRESKRLSVSLDAEIIVNGNTYPVFIGNLSETGLHVFISIPSGSVADFEKHTSFDMRITVESIGELTLSCKKLWSNELPGSPLVRKIGLLIVNPPQEYKKIYKDLFYKERTEITKRPIAVVGMACYYPGAPTIKHLWENILARRREFRRIPDVRLPLDEYFDPDPAATDKTYGTRAAVIDGFEFDWIKRAIPKTVVESSDISHWLALETALRAMEDAGYGLSRMPPDRSGVILGNTLTGEHSRTENLRLRWPFVKKTLFAAADDTGLPPEIRATLAATMESYYKSVFAPVTEDTLAGNLSNTIAGRICNFLNLNGGGYTVDGACSSSLIAVATAATALSHGNLDLAVVGGVDVSLDTFELIGFAKTKALTQDDMRVYDRRASGFIPGEGAGFVVLRRLEDARADGDQIYAVIRGWAISSDGKGGLTAPKAETQALAIQRAYTGSGYGVADLNFVEGHGTGTAAGDVAELKGIAQAMGNKADTPIRPCGITSLKSIIGHTKAASGIGGFIKAVMAVNRRVLPPTANCNEPNQTFSKEAHLVYPILQGEIRPKDESIKAGISGMGFGGINCHVTIESGDAPAAKLAPALRERQLLASGQETELFVISASSKAQLLDGIQTLHKAAQGMSVGEITDLAAQCSNHVNRKGAWRAAVIADTPEALLDNLQQLKNRLGENPPAKGEKFISLRKDVFLSHGMRGCKVGFLFPGQGSQQLNMGKILADRHEWARTFITKASGWLKDANSCEVISSSYKPLDRAFGQAQIDEWATALMETQIAQPAICIASLLWLKKLQRLGINPVAVGGHSLGELIAFHAAGAFDEETLLKLAALRGQAMAAPGEERGIMASLGCSYEKTSEILEGVEGYVIAANINGPHQVVISGEKQAVEHAVTIARRQQIDARILRVSNAFHSKFVAEASEYIRQKGKLPAVLSKSKVKLYTGVGGLEVKHGIKLPNHFAEQIVSPVNFVSLVKNIASACDLLLGVGPGNVISRLAQAIIGEGGPPCLSIESKPGRDRDFNTFLAYYFVQGGNLQWQALYEDRLVRSFVPAQDRSFIVNFCERPFSTRDVQSQRNRPIESDILHKILGENSDIDPLVLSEYLDRRGPFLGAIIKADLETSSINLLPDKQVVKASTGYSQNSAKEKSESQGADVPMDRKAIADLFLELVETRTGFPKDSLSLDMRLLDDLNLDSIKAADLIGELVINLKINADFNVFPYANATIAEIAREFEDVICNKERHTSLSTLQNAPKFSTTWVRNMVVKFVKKNLKKKALDSTRWKGESFIIYCEPEEHLLAQAFEHVLSEHGAEIKISAYTSNPVVEIGSGKKSSNYIAILPKKASAAEFSQNDLLQTINRLRIPAVSSSSENSKKKSITYIQFGGGFFGQKTPIAGISQSAAVAFAASLYYEQPDLKIRVLDFDPGLEQDVLVEKTLLELRTSDNYAVVGHDHESARRVPVPEIQEPANYTPRDIAWGAEDVVLVTGGAKGITAECGLAMAKATGVRMALVGSTPPSENKADPAYNDEIAKTLKRYEDAGLEACYYQCDIVNPDAVLNLVKKVSNSQGKITGVIHGSAINNPRSLQSITSDEALVEVAPKVMGAINLCNAFKDIPPRLFIGFTSIIGISGMVRNGWYAFSNEALNLILCRFQQENPQASTQSIAFSLWDDVGMAVRLGSTNFFAKMGYDAIPVKEGVERFLKLLLYDPCENQVLVTARFPILETFAPNKFLLPSNSRYLTKILYYYPGVEIVVRTRLSLKTDPYLHDHNWRGTYLFPTAFGLEAMAQAVAYVTGKQNFSQVRIENIRLDKPITVNAEKGIEIEIRAVVGEQDASQKGKRIQVEIATEQSNFSVEHFSATFVINEQQDELIKEIVLPETPLDIIPKEDLYDNKFLFQGQQFQRLHHIYDLDSHKCIFESEYHPSGSESKRQQWLLGDPFFRDSLLQSAQLPILQHISLPHSIASIEYFHSKKDTSTLIRGEASIDFGSEEEVQGSVLAVDSNGQLLERITGYKAKIMEYHQEYPTPEELVDPGERDEEIVLKEINKRADLFRLILPAISVSCLQGLKKITKEERHKLELPILRRTVQQCIENNGFKNKDIDIRWLDSGKAVLRNEELSKYDLSLSHDRETILCIAGESPQGCDIQSTQSRNLEEWLTLLGNEAKPLLNELAGGSDSIDKAGTRVWTALEAGVKATGSRDFDLKIQTMKGDSVLFGLCSQNRKDINILTFPVSLTRSSERMIAVSVRHEQKEMAIPEKKKTVRVSYRRPQNNFKNSYDVIVVGAGIGGLTAASLLAKKGANVLVVEQQNKPGGFCTSWERRIKFNGQSLRYVFDAGVNDILGLGHQGNVRKILKTLNIQDQIDWRRVDHQYFIDGLQIKVPRDFDEYSALLCKTFPQEQEGISAFFKEIRQCYIEYQNSENKRLRLSRWKNIPFSQMIDNFVRDQRLKKIVSILHHYITDDVSRVESLTFIPLFGYYLDGGYYPLGGSQVLPNALSLAIRENQGSILLKSSVRRIIIEKGSVVGVELNDGRRLYSQVVISNADIRKTFFELIEQRNLPKHFSTRINGIKPSNSGFLVSLGVNSIPDIEPTTFLERKDKSVVIMIPSKVDSSLAPEGHSCINLLLLVSNNQAKKWNHGDKGYAASKKKVGDELIALSEKIIPDLSRHIVFRQDASPATFKRFAGTTDGAIYGAQIDDWKPSTKTPIRGLYLTGASIWPQPGIASAVKTGELTANSILIQESLSL